MKDSCEIVMCPHILALKASILKQVFFSLKKKKKKETSFSGQEREAYADIFIDRNHLANI